MSHPFFKDVDLDVLLKKEIEAPFKPRVLSDSEILVSGSNPTQRLFTESELQEDSVKKIEEKKECFERFGFNSEGR